MHRAAAVGIGLALICLLASCTTFGNGTPGYIDSTRAKFFTGTRGVEARFDQLPVVLYYSDSARTSAVNDIPFAVEVWNKGSSYTRGGVFVSGYDPHVVQIDEIPIASVSGDACGLRIGDYSLNKIGLTVQCGNNFLWRGNEDNWLQTIRVNGKQWFDSTFLESIDVSLNKWQSGEQRIDINFLGLAGRYDQFEHGKMLIAILAGLSFRQFLGQEYLLAGNTYDFPGGEMDYVQFNGHVVNWPQGADEIPQRFLLTNCYMYTTFAAPMVCIDPAPYSQNRKVCNAFSGSWSSGQGAPVAITRVVQENTPRTAIFHITVENKGGGVVFDPGNLEKCSPYYPGGAKTSDLNVVWFDYVRIGDFKLRCTPDHFVRLQNGKGEFTCTYPIEYAELNSAYQTPLIIELWYGYQSTVQQQVMLKRVI